MTLDELIASQNYAKSHGQARDSYGFSTSLSGGNPAAAATAPGGLPGATPGSYNPSSGGIPGVTPPGTSMENLIAAITGSTGPLGNLISTLTQASSKALKDQFGPGYQTGLDTATANTNRRLSGDITDLLPELQQNAAEAAVAGGQVGGQQYKTKLLRDMGLTRLGVERGALDDLSKIHGATPTVAPFDINHIVPDINLQAMLQQLADVYKSAPVPENVFNRNMDLVRGGLGAGMNAGYGGGPRGTGGTSTGNQSASIPADIIRRYSTERPQGQSRPFDMTESEYNAAMHPPTGGWGVAWNDQGGGAYRGAVPWSDSSLSGLGPAPGGVDETGKGGVVFKDAPLQYGPQPVGYPDWFSDTEFSGY